MRNRTLSLHYLYTEPFLRYARASMQDDGKGILREEVLSS